MDKVWQAIPLREVAEVALSGVDKRFDSAELSVRLCNYLDVYMNNRITSAIDFMHGSATQNEIERFRLQKGDVLITKDSETPDDIGVPALVTEQLENTICGYHLALIRPTNINPAYLFWQLQSDSTKRHHLRVANGVTRFGLGIKAITGTAIPLPSPAEQAAIAGILDAVDTAIEHARQTVSRALILDHSLLNQLLEYGLPQGDATTKRRPSHWQTKRVEEVADVGSGVTLGKDVSGFKSVELPYLRVANVQDGHIDLSVIKTVQVPLDEVDRYRLEAGDVLMTEGGDLDKLGRGALWNGEIPNCLHQNHIFRVRANRQQLDPRFFSFVVESDIAKRYFMRVAKRTTNLASTNKTQVRNFRFPLPPLAEQYRIGEIVASSKSYVKSLRAKENALITLKKSLMHDLLSGKVRVGTVKQLNLFGAGIDP